MRLNTIILNERISAWTHWHCIGLRLLLPDFGKQGRRLRMSSEPPTDLQAPLLLSDLRHLIETARLRAAAAANAELTLLY